MRSLNAMLRSMSIQRQVVLLVSSLSLVSCASTSDSTSSGLSPSETESVTETTVASPDREDNISPTKESLAEVSENGGCLNYAQRL